MGKGEGSVEWEWDRMGMGNKEIRNGWITKVFCPGRLGESRMNWKWEGRRKQRIEEHGMGWVHREEEWNVVHV